jgi:hypothetical protein
MSRPAILQEAFSMSGKANLQNFPANYQSTAGSMSMAIFWLLAGLYAC